MSDEIRFLISKFPIDKLSVRPYNDLLYSNPLQLAAKNGHFGVCGLMIGVGSAPPVYYRHQFWNSYARKKLVIAVSNSHVEIAKLLLTNKLGEKIIPRILEEHSFIWKP